MRIAVVYRSFEQSRSLARQTVEVAGHLSRSHEVHVYSIARRTDCSLAPGCVFHDVPVTRLGDGHRFSARELRSFACNATALLAGNRYDVVYACAPSIWGADVLHVPGIARMEARLQGIPRWRMAAALVRHPGDAARLQLERRALRHPTLKRVHVAAPSVSDAVGERYGIEQEHVLVVTPAVRLDEFRPTEDREAARAAAAIVDADRLVLLFCGGDFARKGLDRAIDALADARTDAVLLVVGDGSEDEYRRRAEARGVGNRVRFLGARRDAWRLFQAADILLLPTRADIWGITPIEAMACGVPSIVSAAAGSARAVADAGAGIVIQEPFDAGAFRDAIDALASNPDRRAEMGRVGVAAAVAHSFTERCRRVEADLVAVAAAAGSRPTIRSSTGRRQSSLAQATRRGD